MGQGREKSASAFRLLVLQPVLPWHLSTLSPTDFPAPSSSRGPENTAEDSLAIWRSPRGLFQGRLTASRPCAGRRVRYRSEQSGLSTARSALSVPVRVGR